MRLSILMMITSIMLIFVSCTNNGIDNSCVIYHTAVKTEFSVFKEQIVSAEQIASELFTSQIEKTVISHIENAQVYKYVGPNSSFDAVCLQMANYCTENVAEFLIRENGYVNVDGQIGFIAATGEVRYSEFDVSDMKIISDIDDTLSIVVTKSTIDGDASQDYLYTFKKYESGNYVITELQIYDN